jgi:hypothetical protein
MTRDRRRLLRGGECRRHRRSKIRQGQFTLSELLGLAANFVGGTSEKGKHSGNDKGRCFDLGRIAQVAL